MERCSSGRSTSGGDLKSWDLSVWLLSPLRAAFSFQGMHQGWGNSRKGSQPQLPHLDGQRSTGGSFAIQLSFLIRALLLAISARQQQLS